METNTITASPNIITNSVDTCIITGTTGSITLNTDNISVPSSLYTKAFTSNSDNINSNDYTIKSLGSTATFTFTYKPPVIEKPSHWNTAPKDLNPTWNSLLGASATNNYTIVGIKILVPNKVVKVYIYDGTEHEYKQICREPDTFDLKYALALAWAKHYGNSKHHSPFSFTTEGIENLAYSFIHHYKEPNKEFDRAIKAYNRWQKEQDKEAAEKAEREAVIARRREKNRKRREKAKRQVEDHDINLIAEAIRRSKE